MSAVMASSTCARCVVSSSRSPRRPGIILLGTAWSPWSYCVRMASPRFIPCDLGRSRGRDLRGRAKSPLEHDRGAPLGALKLDGVHELVHQEHSPAPRGEAIGKPVLTHEFEIDARTVVRDQNHHV